MSPIVKRAKKKDAPIILAIFEAVARINRVQRSRRNWERAIFFVLLAYVLLFICLNLGWIEPAPFIVKDQ